MLCESLNPKEKVLRYFYLFCFLRDVINVVSSGCSFQTTSVRCDLNVSVVKAFAMLFGSVPCAYHSVVNLRILSWSSSCQTSKCLECCLGSRCTHAQLRSGPRSLYNILCDNCLELPPLSDLLNTFQFPGVLQPKG